MSGPAASLDPAFAAALDRYTVPAASAGFADRIVAAVRHQGGDAPAASRIARDRRGPWRRRAITGGLALLLGTTAAAATLIERVVGIRLPDAVALLSPLPVAATPPPARRVPSKQAPARPRAPRLAVVPTPAPALAPPVADAPLPLAGLRARVAAMPPAQRRAIRARLAAMPPAERRAVVRGAIARRIAARAAERRAVLNGETPPPTAVGGDRPWLRDRPVARAAMADRVAAIRAARVARLEATLPPPDLAAALPPLPNASPAIAQPASPAQLAPVRLDRLRAMRDLRAQRRAWRRMSRR